MKDMVLRICDAGRVIGRIVTIGRYPGRRGECQPISDRIIRIGHRLTIRLTDLNQAVSVVVRVMRDTSTVGCCLTQPVGRIGEADRLTVEVVHLRQTIQRIIVEGVRLSVRQLMAQRIPRRIVAEGLEGSVRPGLLGRTVKRIVHKVRRMVVRIDDCGQIAIRIVAVADRLS